ncbi:hypothetical protein BDV96DRAFT_576608 [Lophiotrema nucula]|uniref:Uncharacterized protein n=1 Tax=Lophiotrema nucula TaxID=690887 RepID=A0A6A5Z661_9PLEO|nr:hypothetical protein BDV96DRAFT_576608 [Lophiotrema nucula]
MALSNSTIGVAAEAFYRTNTFFLTSGYMAFFAPPPPFRHHLRRLETTLVLDDTYSNTEESSWSGTFASRHHTPKKANELLTRCMSWGILKKLTAPDSFCNLTDLHLELDCQFSFCDNSEISVPISRGVDFYEAIREADIAVKAKNISVDWKVALAETDEFFSLF